MTDHSSGRGFRAYGLRCSGIQLTVAQYMAKILAIQWHRNFGAADFFPLILAPDIEPRTCLETSGFRVTALCHLRQTYKSVYAQPSMAHGLP
jgi:hypothetical protein